MFARKFKRICECISDRRSRLVCDEHICSRVSATSRRVAPVADMLSDGDDVNCLDDVRCCGVVGSGTCGGYVPRQCCGRELSGGVCR